LFQLGDLKLYYNFNSRCINSSYFLCLPNNRFFYCDYFLSKTDKSNQLLILNRNLNVLASNKIILETDDFYYYDFVIKYYDNKIYLFYKNLTSSSSNRKVCCKIYDLRLNLLKAHNLRNLNGLQNAIILDDDIWVQDTNHIFKFNLSFDENHKYFKKINLETNDILVNVDDKNVFFINKLFNSFQIVVKIMDKSNGQLKSKIQFNKQFLMPDYLTNYCKFICFDDKSNIFIFYQHLICVFDSSGNFLFKKNIFLNNFYTYSTIAPFFYLLENQIIKMYDTFKTFY
jgi:hypothetical protein